VEYIVEQEPTFPQTVQISKGSPDISSPTIYQPWSQLEVKEGCEDPTSPAHNAPLRRLAGPRPLLHLALLHNGPKMARPSLRIDSRPSNLLARW
jgi:hypothetical protein